LINIIKFDSITSTNDWAKENAADLPLPSLITADEQTAGRGRQGKKFYSPGSTGLYFSLIFEAESGFDLITPASAVCVCDAIKKFSGKETGIKWVNDIFLNGKKVAGILTERFSSNGRMMTVVGIGVNFTTGDFPEDLPEAGSLGFMPDKTAFAVNVAESLLTINGNFSRDDILSAYKSRLFIVGKKIEFEINGRRYSGTAEGINSDCNLIVNTKEGKMILSSGEISIIMR